MEFCEVFFVAMGYRTPWYGLFGTCPTSVWVWSAFQAVGFVSSEVWIPTRVPFVTVHNLLRTEVLDAADALRHSSLMATVLRLVKQRSSIFTGVGMRTIISKSETFFRHSEKGGVTATRTSACPKSSQDFKNLGVLCTREKKNGAGDKLDKVVGQAVIWASLLKLLPLWPNLG